jgi:aryl-alcohol dehydrogenase-like predicted oxidoreductase
MPRRPLGRSGLTVTPIGLGLAALGRPGYINLGHGDDLTGGTHPGHDVAAMEARTHDVLDAAAALGIGYVDAARSYGRSEEFLASWLSARAIAAGTVTVGSKWGYTYTAGWQIEAEAHEVKDHSLATLDRQWPETEALLGPWISLVQVHSATLESGILDDDTVLDRLAEHRDAGTTIGLTTTGAAQAATIRRALDVERGGERLFGSVQSTWNLLEPSAGPALAEAHDAGLGVIVKEVVANGRLTGRGVAVHPATVASLAPDAPLDQIAIAAALAQPWADVVLSGAATIEHLQSNVAALGLEVDLDAAAAMARPAEPYWAERGAMAWN